MNQEEKTIHPIDQYYRDIEARKRKAEQVLQEARKRGADRKEIAKLEERALWAGYTGD